MSTTVREQYEVGDLDPSAVLELARDNERELREREFLKLRLAAHWADLHPATQDTGVETLGARRSWPTSPWAGTAPRRWRRSRPKPFALALGMSPSAGAQLIADALDLRHRLPLLWKRMSPAGGARLAGPPGRPPDPPPPQDRRDLGRRTPRRPRHLRPGHRRPFGRPRHRHVRPRDPRRPRERRPGRLGRHADPPRPDRLPRHLPPRSHRRHPGPQEPSTTTSAGSPTSCTSTATPARSASARSKPSASSPANPQTTSKPKVKVVRARRGPRPRTRRPRRR